MDILDEPNFHQHGNHGFCTDMTAGFVPTSSADHFVSRHRGCLVNSHRNSLGVCRGLWSLHYGCLHLEKNHEHELECHSNSKKDERVPSHVIFGAESLVVSPQRIQNLLPCGPEAEGWRYIGVAHKGPHPPRNGRRSAVGGVAVLDFAQRRESPSDWRDVSEDPERPDHIVRGNHDASEQEGREPVLQETQRTEQWVIELN
mmetsp:Transcript_46359/g.72577  ORF Transcript_46359/g.72577 Transcript_46359/m.72577 type:complete len:201 (-) Transcript_46359:706-1308(-)